MILRAALAALLAGAFAIACNGAFYFDDFPATPDGGAPDAAVGCASDTDCHVSTLHCAVDSGACVPCLASADCTTAGARVCEAQQCVGCATDQDCASGSACDPTTKTCLVRCHDLDDCHGAAPLCDITRGLCVSCVSNDACSGATPACNVASGMCVQCVSDGQCASAAPLCDPGGQCVVCRTTADCAAPAQCDPVAHVCV